jgi:hypothetical protein
MRAGADVRRIASRDAQDEVAQVGWHLFEVVPNALVTVGGIHFPEKFHLEAWRTLTAECDQRQAGHPARPIVLARRRFDDLPSDVKAAMRDR